MSSCETVLKRFQSKNIVSKISLVFKCGIVNTNIRDQFSAGGKVNVVTINGAFEGVPAAFGRIQKNKDLIEETIIAAKKRPKRILGYKIYF